MRGRCKQHDRDRSGAPSEQVCTVQYICTYVHMYISTYIHTCNLSIRGRVRDIGAYFTHSNGRQQPHAHVKCPDQRVCMQMITEIVLWKIRIDSPQRRNQFDRALQD